MKPRATSDGRPGPSPGRPRTPARQREVEAWTTLARELAARVAAVDPDWTDQPDSDPGVTLVELAAYLAESLLARDTTSPGDLARLQVVVTRLARLAGEPCRDATLTRVHYSSGMVLSADDFEQEQQYHRDRARRHNRLLHGTGIVHGLEVTVEDDDGTAMVVVSPGLAISPDGEELVLCDPVRIPPCPSPAPCFVCLRLAERPAAVLPGGVASRIEEAAEAVVVDHVAGGHLVIAGLVHERDAWRVDPGVVPPRVSR